MESDLLATGGKLFAVLGLVVANGFFVAAEFALVGVRPSRVEELVRQGKLDRPEPCNVRSATSMPTLPRPSLG